MSRKDRLAAVADSIFAPMQRRELLAGLGETVHKKVPLDAIQANPDQPRNGVDETSDAFADLVGSIRENGLIQPISLWQLDEDNERYLVIAGERRFRAFSHLAQANPSEFSRIPATVTILRGDNPEAKALMLGLIENVVREDLKDGERAAALARLKSSTGWTYETMAERMGMAVNRVRDLAVIARHDVVVDAVNDGRITQKQAIVIGHAVRDPELVRHLVPAVQGMGDMETREVVRIVRIAADEVSAHERVHDAAETVRRGGSRRTAGGIRPTRPMAVTAPFVWTTESQSADVATRALDTTRIGMFPSVTVDEWLGAIATDLAAFRDMCSRHPHGADLWQGAVDLVGGIVQQKPMS